MNCFDLPEKKALHFDSKEGTINAFSIEKKQNCGFDGYYVTAKADEKLSADGALELYYELSDMSFTAIYSHSLYWVRPAFGDTLSQIPEKSTAVILDKGNGSYIYIMAAVGNEYKTYISGMDGRIVFKLYSQVSSDSINGELSFIVGYGDSVKELVRRGAQAMCAFMNNGLALRSAKKMPEVLEYLGWCSWDAFQIRVNHGGLVKKALEFKDKKVPIKYAIIDDMWGDAPNLKTSSPDDSFDDMVKTMHASALNAFEGDPERFPSGLSAAVADLKANGIEKVGLWFPTTGYWYGLVKDGPAYKEQKDNVEACAGGRIICTPTDEAAERYFDIFCEKAKEFGCDFVKIDNQSCHFFYKDMYPIAKSAKALQNAIDKAAFRHFDGALINCMGMPAECMLQRPLSAVSRCSDDFMPESKSWFAKNVLECAYNGLLQGRFYINDWDMWWTDDAQAEKNAVCHAISGGPVYLSDKLGRTNPDVIRPLVFDDGRILRLSDSASPTDDCVFGDPRKSTKPLKIFNTFSGGGTVAAFNISESGATVNGVVKATDTGLRADKSYLYYEYFTGDFGFVMGDEDIHFSLATNDDIRYFTFIEKTKNSPLFIGRTDKFNSRLAVINQDADSVTLYEGGPFAFVSEDEYEVYDEHGEPIPTERYGIIITGECCPKNKTLRFKKYDN